jgi:hypothetical protein
MNHFVVDNHLKNLHGLEKLMGILILEEHTIQNIW